MAGYRYGEGFRCTGSTLNCVLLGKSGPEMPNMDGGIKLDSSMCHLRGLLMLKLNRTDKAKECFLEALLLDVKNYESFDLLVSGEMMTVDEGAPSLPMAVRRLSGCSAQSGKSFKHYLIESMHEKKQSSCV